MGLPEDLEQQAFLFGLFLSRYLLSVLRNLLNILAFSSDSHLHMSLHFFLSNLSLAGIGYTYTIIPKMTVDI